MFTAEPIGIEGLGRDEELKLLGFLATLAGLLGIVVAVSQFEIGSASPETVRAYFSVILVVFMFVSALTYLGALQDEDIRQLNMAVLGYFSALSGFVVGLAAATLYPVTYQLGGFLITAFVVSLVLYWPLFRWQSNLKWRTGKSVDRA